MAPKHYETTFGSSHRDRPFGSKLLLPIWWREWLRSIFWGTREFSCATKLCSTLRSKAGADLVTVDFKVFNGGSVSGATPAQHYSMIYRTETHGNFSRAFTLLESLIMLVLLTVLTAVLIALLRAEAVKSEGTARAPSITAIAHREA